MSISVDYVKVQPAKIKNMDMIRRMVASAKRGQRFRVWTPFMTFVEVTKKSLIEMLDEAYGKGVPFALTMNDDAWHITVI